MQKFFGFIFILFHLSVYSQNCSIQVSDKVCLGNTSLFILKYDTPNSVISYNWNFGNGATSAQSSPVYQYPQRGTFTPSVTVIFSSGTCTVNGPAVKVLGKPNANFNITTLTPQCFKNNQLCLTDNSSVGADNAPLTKRLVLFGDGGYNISSPIVGNTVCYNYIDTLGGTYNIVLEVTDTNNCTDRKEIPNAITIRPKMPELSFITDNNSSCNLTPVKYTNTSKINLSRISSYLWDFGDGTTAASPWNTFTHVYSKAGVFAATLSIIDLDGCKDTFVVYPAGINHKIDSSIILSKNNVCYNSNKIEFGSINYLPALVYWAIYKVGNPIRVDTISSNVTDTIYHFPDCGQYQLRMYVISGNCFVRTDSLINIKGPRSVIQTNNDQVRNSIQCEINDTVYFRSPTVDHSCFYKNGEIYRLWDFDDAFAPNCTTDTKLGLNVNMNCRYSKDSIFVKHYYTPGKEKCYFPKLILKDLETGCADTNQTSLKLTQPDAGWDSSIVPPRRGLYWTGDPCKSLHFYLDQTLPKCGREKAWFMPDSACPGSVWIPIDTTQDEFFWSYTKICDPSGFRTVGLIIKNGKDKNGNPCYDTAWYHHMVRVLPVNPDFILERLSTGCAPWLVKISLVDSIQDSIKTARIYNKTIVFGSNDSIIHSQNFYVYKSGYIKFSVILTNTRGCSLSSDRYEYFGFAADFRPSKTVLCMYDSLNLQEANRYFNSNYAFWSDTARFNNGKEQLIWDFGEGLGFHKTVINPSYKYKQPGNYKVKMIALDSMGCRDTVVYATSIKVIDVKAIVDPMQPRYLCAPQFLPFSERSFVIDSSALYASPPYDSIVLRTWNFGDNKANSVLKNPVHDYTANGLFQVKLTLQTATGCIDSATTPVLIDGPKPSFKLLVDSIGCAPYEVKFKNTTGYPLINWIWFFRDQNNTTASTQSDTNVNFTYTRGGLYKIFLLGEDTLFDPISGQIKSCHAVYPDSNNANVQLIEVRVIEPVKISMLGPDSVCIGQAFELKAQIQGKTDTIHWYFSDSLHLFSKLWPDTIITHTFYQTGIFRSKLYAQSPGNFCVDTAFKSITTMDIKANFDLDDSQSPFIKLTNNSSNAVRYEWDFGHPRSGARNFSTEENPTHSYAGDSGTFTICLKAFNALDCFDTLCKKTRADESRLIIPNVFTPDNDNVNDAYDIDMIGGKFYELTIYNRWGDLVFYGNRDGIGNDGINWNGKNKNNGEDCPEGVYFFIFNYQMKKDVNNKSVHGTITLIRD